MPESRVGVVKTKSEIREDKTDYGASPGREEFLAEVWKPVQTLKFAGDSFRVGS